jgi:hypothetical protein
VSNELTEAERAAERVLDAALPNTSGLHVDFAREIVAAVRPIIEAEITQHPDVNEMNRGFGNCPHCFSLVVMRCHECPAQVSRESAHQAGWRMDHIGGYGCIALCPYCRDDNL